MSYAWGEDVTMDAEFATNEPGFLFTADQVTITVRDPNYAVKTYTGADLSPSGPNSWEVKVRCERSGWWKYAAEADSPAHHVVTPSRSFYVRVNESREG